MTASLPHKTVSVKDAAAVRKRRRRAPAGGAPDDCFTCSKRKVKCDRRRPYCSQCLEIGNECSGYKTQLTWGVGVASRGKLRGLSLPVAKAPPVSREPKTPPVAKGRATSIAAAVMAARWAGHEEMKRHRGPINILSLGHAESAPAISYPGPDYDYFSLPQPDQASHVSQHGWGSSYYSPDVVHSPDATGKYARVSLPLGADTLSSSVGSVSDFDYLPPNNQAYSRDGMPFGNRSSLPCDGFAGSSHSSVAQSPPPSLVPDHARVPSSYPGLVYSLSQPSSSLMPHLDSFDARFNNKLMRECDNFGEHHMATCPAFPF